jgi:hypothetical protein
MKWVETGSLLSSGIEEGQREFPSQNQLGARSASGNSPEAQSRLFVRAWILPTAIISLFSTSTIERVHADPPAPTATIPCSVSDDSTSDSLGFKPILFISSDSGQPGMVRANPSNGRLELVDGHRVFVSADRSTVLAELGAPPEGPAALTAPCGQCRVVKLALPSRIRSVRNNRPGQVCQSGWTPARPLTFDEYTAWMGRPLAERRRTYCQPTPLITGTTDGPPAGQDAACDGLSAELTAALNQVENPSQRNSGAAGSEEPETAPVGRRSPAGQATPAPSTPPARGARPPAAGNEDADGDSEGERDGARSTGRNQAPPPNEDRASPPSGTRPQTGGTQTPGRANGTPLTEGDPHTASETGAAPVQQGVSGDHSPSTPGTNSPPNPSTPTPSAQPPASLPSATSPTGTGTANAGGSPTPSTGAEQNPATAQPPSTGNGPATPANRAANSALPAGVDISNSEPDSETGMGNCDKAASISEKYSCESQRNTARALRTVRKVTDEGVVTTVEAVSNAAKARIEEARNATRDGATRENTIALREAYSSAADVYTASASVKAAAGATETTIGIIQLAQALEQGKEADHIQQSTDDDDLNEIDAKSAPAISSGSGDETVKSVVLSFSGKSPEAKAILSRLESEDVPRLQATRFVLNGEILEVTVPEEQSAKAIKAVQDAVKRTGRAAADQKRAEANRLLTEGSGALSKGIGYGIQSGLEFASAAAMRTSAAGLTMTPNTSAVAISTGMDPLRMDINMPGAATASTGGTGGSVVGSGQTVSNAEANQNSASTDPNNPNTTPPGGLGVAGNGQDQTSPTPIPVQPREFASGGGGENGGGGGSTSSAEGGPQSNTGSPGFNGGMGGGGQFGNNGPQPPYQDPYAVQPGASPGPNEGYSVNAAQGGGRGGGRGSSSNEISDLLGKFMNANKAPDGTPQSPGSANFARAGASRQIAHQWSPLGPNADLFNRVHETYQGRMRDGRLR